MTVRDAIDRIDDRLTDLTQGIRHWYWDRLDHDDVIEQDVYVTNPRREDDPRALTDNDVDDFMLAAERREDPLWESIMGYLRGPLYWRAGKRARLLEREIRWLRRQAYKDGKEWGKR